MSDLLRQLRPSARLAAVALLCGSLASGCGTPNSDIASPLEGLSSCPSADSVVGVFTGQDQTRNAEDSDDVVGFNTWALTVDGDVRQLTTDDVHMAAVISPDARTLYQARSSGRLIADSIEAPNILERMDIATGEVEVIGELQGIVDTSVSADGRRLAVAHSFVQVSEGAAERDGVTVIDLDSGKPFITVQAPADVPKDVFSAINQVSLSPDGGRMAYELVVELEQYSIEHTLRVRNLDSDEDVVLYTTEGVSYISDIAWSADGRTIIAQMLVRDPDATMDIPSQIRTVLVDVGSGSVSEFEGFALQASPIRTDGGRLLGAVSTDSEGSAQGMLVSWDRDSRFTTDLTVTPSAWGVSIAPCAYETNG